MNLPSFSVTSKPMSKETERDPNGFGLNDPGAKADSGKPLPWLVLGDFARALNEVVKVGTDGARKYTPKGWIQVPDGEQRYLEAFGRHTLQLMTGEVVDKLSGSPHLAHMIWNLLAVLELQKRAETVAVSSNNCNTDPPVGEREEGPQSFGDTS